MVARAATSLSTSLGPGLGPLGVALAEAVPPNPDPRARPALFAGENDHGAVRRQRGGRLLALCAPWLGLLALCAPGLPGVFRCRKVTNHGWLATAHPSAGRLRPPFFLVVVVLFRPDDDNNDNNDDDDDNNDNDDDNNEMVTRWRSWVGSLRAGSKWWAAWSTASAPAAP